MSSEPPKMNEQVQMPPQYQPYGQSQQYGQPDQSYQQQQPQQQIQQPEQQPLQDSSQFAKKPIHYLTNKKIKKGKTVNCPNCRKQSVTRYEILSCNRYTFLWTIFLGITGTFLYWFCCKGAHEERLYCSNCNYLIMKTKPSCRT